MAHQSRPEQRPDGRPHRMLCGNFNCFTALHPHQGSVDNDNGIINQHPQGQNQGSQRNLLQIDVHDKHPGEGHQNRQQQHCPRSADRYASP